MIDHSGHSIAGERPYLLKLLAWIGFAGCAALIIGTIVAQFFVPDYDWVADTISDLAAGEWEIIMDVALYGFAAGLFATSLAAAHAHLGQGRWSVGVLSLALLAALVVVVGARNEYGDKDSDGVVIHSYLVYGLGLLFVLAPWSMAAGFRPSHRSVSSLLIFLGLLWAIAAPIFLMVPTGVDGLFERILGLIACAIIVTINYAFLQRGRMARPY